MPDINKDCILTDLNNLQIWIGLYRDVVHTSLLDTKDLQIVKSQVGSVTLNVKKMAHQLVRVSAVNVKVQDDASKN